MVTLTDRINMTIAVDWDVITDQTNNRPSQVKCVKLEERIHLFDLILYVASTIIQL